MSKKKKEQKGLERKITSLISSPALKEFNYKQIAFALGVNDTKGRNDIIKILNILLKKEKIIKFLYKTIIIMFKCLLVIKR